MSSFGLRTTRLSLPPCYKSHTVTGQNAHLAINHAYPDSERLTAGSAGSMTARRTASSERHGIPELCPVPGHAARHERGNWRVGVYLDDAASEDFQRKACHIGTPWL